MELKLVELNHLVNLRILLIVPYGIETDKSSGTGILSRLLLIVPYGIETCVVARFGLSFFLLIVPYGIETPQPPPAQPPHPASNRTLWN